LVAIGSELNRKDGKGFNHRWTQIHTDGEGTKRGARFAATPSLGHFAMLYKLSSK
jgi:hypothetical protein